MSTLPPESNGEQPEAAAPQPPAENFAPPAPPAPPAQPEAPQYQAPPAGAGYQQAPAPAADPVNTITLNYWLSVFFTWLPALIFWLMEKDKGNARATAFHVANFNFSLLRTAVYIAIVIVGWIPYLGWLIAILLWIATIVLFVFHIMAAVKAPEAYRNGGKTDQFIFNVPIIK